MISSNKIQERNFPHVRSEIHIHSPHTRVAQKGWSCVKHVHHMMFELLLVLDGSFTAIIGNEKYEQKAGDLVIISPMVMHGYRADLSDQVTLFAVHIQVDDSDLLHLFETANEGYYPVNHPLNSEAVPLVKQMMEHMYEEQSSKTHLLMALYTLIGTIQSHFKLRDTLMPHQHSKLPFLIAREVQAYVVQQDEQPSVSSGDWLEAISRKLGCSRRHCHRVFKQAYGISPREYLMVLKQQEAMHMLVSSTETIERIAHRIGYENVQSFSRQFAAWVGCTPGVFRKNHLDDVRHLTHLDHFPQDLDLDPKLKLTYSKSSI